jgi:DNA (cytosine-5)-methyltransferase 1
MNLVDLFCGCGGFSLGAHNAGFNVAAAFDNDPILTSSFKYNFPKTPLCLKDISALSGLEIRRFVKQPIGGVFGGPPCQGFSDIGRRDATDPRRELLGHFFRIVSELEPAFFVMENVRGLAYADAKVVLERAIDSVADRYNVFGPIILDASDFGAATRRRRLFVIGTKKLALAPVSIEDFQDFLSPPATVRSAISDLLGAEMIASDELFDQWRITKRGRPCNYARMLRLADGTFTSHRVVKHKSEVARRYARVAPGSVDEIGRHPRLSWDGQCPTLRAGTGADKGSRQAVRPLHPDEPRVITVREAARLQGFPDGHRFHPTVWHSFRMIGNSVSPIIAEVVFKVIRRKLRVSDYRLAAE